MVGGGSQGFLPIPTYDEAIASRPSSSGSAQRDTILHDAEDQPLFSRSSDCVEGYNRPTVESLRSSLDLDDILQDEARNASTDELRREIAQMDIMEPSDDRRHLLGGGRFSKRFPGLSNTLSALHLPQLQHWMPSWDRMRSLLPNFKPNWIIFGRFIALILVISVAYIIFLSNVFRVGRNGPGMRWFDPEVIREYVLDHIDNSIIRERMQYFTNFTHLAGTAGGEMQALYTEAVFAEYLEDVSLERFDVYLNYPIEDAGARRVTIVEPSDTRYEAKIEEDIIYPDEPWKKQVPAFHGYSKTGTAQGPLVYANYGLDEDYSRLREHDIAINGSIVLIRHQPEQPDSASKVHAAEQQGAIGCLIYRDPADYGGGDSPVFPGGRSLPETGVQRASVALAARVLGDPLSPGFASLPDEEKRLPVKNNPALTNIPSLPLSAQDAKGLLEVLENHGVKGDQDSTGGISGIEYWTGDSSSPVVLLKNEQEEVEKRPILNVLGRIKGSEQPEKSIIVGNQRDAWCFGAGDPNGGTAVLLEVVRVLGELQQLGWRPLRTIEFASWDAGAYNVIGATEHVEARIDEIREHAFAYVNMDVAATGDRFRASASPVLSSAILHVLDRLVEQETSNKTLRAVFAERGGRVEGLDASSAHAPFQMLAGCSSLDIGYVGSPSPSHSCYDNFDWINNFGDPGFLRHRNVAQILALLVLDLCDREILPFDFEAYAEAIQGYIRDLETDVGSRHPLNYTSLHAAADEMSTNAKQFTEWSQAWNNAVWGASNGFESKTLAIKRISHNTRMANFETNLLDSDGGLPGRQQFKHLIVAPQAHNAHAPSFFPAVRDALDQENWDLAQQHLDNVAGKILYASRKLLH